MLLSVYMEVHIFNFEKQNKDFIDMITIKIVYKLFLCLYLQHSKKMQYNQLTLIEVFLPIV